MGEGFGVEGVDRAQNLLEVTLLGQVGLRGKAKRPWEGGGLSMGWAPISQYAENLSIFRMRHDG